LKVCRIGFGQFKQGGIIMRFEQLKHASNTIVRKKLYKSGKNWVVMSSLALVGGLALLGSSQINTVKADVVSGSDTEQQEQVNTDDTKIQSSSAGATGDETSGNTEDNRQGIVNGGNTTPSNEKNANASEPADSAYDKTPTEPSQTYEAPATTSGNIIATSNTDKNTEPAATSSYIDSGDGWRIDSNHALHFTSSNTELSGDPNNGWQADQYHAGPDALTSISFDDNVTAGSSLNGLFQGLTAVKSISGLNNLDTSKTTDFSSMFVGCQNLETADVSGLHTSAGTNFSDMFVSCPKLQSVDISKWDLSHGTNFIAMFAGCTSLKSIDLSNWDMSKLGPANYGGLLGGTSLQSLKLGSKDKLDGSIGLQDPETSNDSIKGGWTSDDYKTTDNPNGFYNSAALEGDGPNPSLYDGVNGKATTWQTYPKFVNFKVQYVDDSDPKNPITYTDPTTYSARAGSSFNLNQYLPGYQMIDSEQDGITGTVPEENNGVLIHKTSLVPYAPVTLEIQESYLDGKKTKVVQIPLTIYTPLTDYDYSSQLLNDGIEWDNVSKDDSKVLFGVPDGPSVTDVIADFRDYKIASVNDLINVVASHSIESPDAYGPESLTLVNPGFAGKTFEFKIVYKKGGTISAGPSHSYSTPTPTITDFNQNVATFGDRPAVQVYNTEGNTIDETVAPDVDWHSDKKMLLNGITYYSLATYKWVKSSDAYIFFANSADVRTYQGNYVQLTDGNNGKILSRELQAGSDWYTDRIAMFDGEKYYRVATSEFVKAPAVYEYKAEPRVVKTNKNTVVYDELGNTVDLHLPFSEYKSDIAVNINGNTYYRIATNLFVRADNI